MSKLFRPFFLVLAFVPSSWVAANIAWTPPELIVSIRIIDVDGKKLVYVNGIFRSEDRRPEFRKSFSLANLARGRRVGQVVLQNKANKPIKFREVAEREYLAEEDIESWGYVVDLSPVADPAQAAHASWLKEDEGILMMDELWPLSGPSGGVVNLKLPDGWIVTDQKLSEGSVIPLPKINDGGDWYGASRDTVLGIGKGWRKIRWSERGLTCDIAISGDWHFSDTESVDTCREILADYKEAFGEAKSAKVLIAKYPVSMRAGEWHAETRGNTVTIISSDMPFKSQSVQRLHEQLRHELFHLWIPNGVNLTGNYDWFYEGFALYQSLRMAVAMNRITFHDFLDTLSRAHTIDSARQQSLSLVDASRNRFRGANTQVYARGMLVAFLIDLELLERSRGNRSVENILRELYARHKKPSTEEDGNEAVIALLKSNPGLELIVLKYVSGTDKIDWTNRLAVAGISDRDPGPVTTLKVDEKLSGRQKTLLDKLGYNNWRKLSPSSK